MSLVFKCGGHGRSPKQRAPSREARRQRPGGHFSLPRSALCQGKGDAEATQTQRALCARRRKLSRPRREDHGPSQADAMVKRQSHPDGHLQGRGPPSAPPRSSPGAPGCPGRIDYQIEGDLSAGGCVHACMREASHPVQKNLFGVDMASAPLRPLFSSGSWTQRPHM